MARRPVVHSLTLEPTLGIMIPRLVGTVRVADLLSALKEMVSHPQWVVGMPSILDVREMDLSELSFDEVALVAEKAKSGTDRLGGGRTAIVTASAVNFGRTRQYEALADGAGGRQRRVFITMDDALAWHRQSVDDDGDALGLPR